MSLLLRTIRRQNGRLTSPRHVQSRSLTNNVIEEGDIVLLKNTRAGNYQPILTPPLLAAQKVKQLYDHIKHDVIIGKSLSRSIITSAKRAQYRASLPTLAEYTDHSARIVTPIYSQDANLIVSLLDLNPTTPGHDADKIEIFEAGTGHGALTMFLSKAIHAANTCPPAEEQSEEYKEWLAQRRAVIHTLDISETHSHHAQRTTKNFRNGMYSHNIDFHTGTIENYLKPRIEAENPFLDHAILDLPNTHLNMEVVSKAMKDGGTLITFCPSITQILACFELAKDQNLPFFLETVLEIGGAAGVGGREWDLRRVKVRSSMKAELTAVTESEEVSMPASEEVAPLTDVPSPDINKLSATDGDLVKANEEQAVQANVSQQRWETVCRPKVGARIIGGGFVGVWRKKAL